MKQRLGYTFEPDAAEQAAQQRAMASILMARARQGIGMFTPGKS